MRSSGTIDSVRRLGVHDHLCWAYDDPADFRQATLEYLCEGLSIGQRILYVGSESAEQLRSHLAGIDGIDDLIDRGVAGVATIDDAYRRSAAGLTDQVAACAAATEAALAEGHTGLRVAAEGTALVRTASQREAFARYEHMVDRYTVDNPFSALCGYHAGELGPTALAEIACVHPLVRGEVAPFRLFAAPHAAAALAGEIDVTSVDLFRRTLGRTLLGERGERLVVDAADLSFVDHRGLLALDEHAREHAIAVVLQGAGPATARVADVLELGTVQVETPA